MNWGLGHATRSTPIIEALIQKGYEVHVASDEIALEFLKTRFLDLLFHELPSYKVEYSKSNNQKLKIASQVPKFISVLNKEQKKIQELHDEYVYDLSISDNRFGAYIKGVRSIYITHQVSIKSPFASSILKKLHAQVINKYDECWIPDFPPPNNLAGDLSKDVSHLPKAYYIGMLTHLSIQKEKSEYDVCYLLSGPEPQRSILEKEILKQHPNHLKGILVRGSNKDEINHNNIKVVNLASSKELSQILSQSESVVSRTGYSSIMDIANTHLKLLMIPTPGQTEQEYLVEILKEKGVLIQKQSELDLSKMDSAIPLKIINEKVVDFKTLI